MNNATILLGTTCLAGAFVYIIARWKENHRVAWAAKALASSSFVALAVYNGAPETIYGQFILAALILSWLGDILLLSMKKVFLLAGMAAFFAAHVAFIAAFGGKDLDVGLLGTALAAIGIFSSVVIIWLWKYLDGVYKIAVPLYLVAIMAMTSLAIAASARSLPSVVGSAALAFAISDLSVARDRFVQHGVSNKVWGLPLYYFAQLLFASSVTQG